VTEIIRIPQPSFGRANRRSPEEGVATSRPGRPEILRPLKGLQDDVCAVIPPLRGYRLLSGLQPFGHLRRLP
jgi:hypothetical protein